MLKAADSFVILGEFLQPLAEADRGNFPPVMFIDGEKASPLTSFKVSNCDGKCSLKGRVFVFMKT